MQPSWLGPIRQIGYLVEDLDEAVQQWLTLTGVGPWTCFRDVTLEAERYGEPTRVRMNVALSYQGEMQIELIEVLNDTPSPYRDAEGRLLLGLHHVACLSAGLDADVAMACRRGYRVCFRGGNAATQVAYLESPLKSGGLLELIAATPQMEQMLRDGTEEARHWEGDTPIRNIQMG